MTPETELAWAAGFFDGEGASGVSRNRARGEAYIRLQLAQADREPLDRFAAAVGVGNVTGPYEFAGHNRRPMYRWQVAGTKAVRVMELLLPYLGQIKRRQFATATEEVA